MHRRSIPALATLVLALGWAQSTTAAPQPSGPQTDGAFRKVILVSDRDTDGNNEAEDNLKDPMELSVARDGRVFYAQRNGEVHFWDPKTNKTVHVGTIPVFQGLEDGLLGITLDPDFESNNHLYLFYSLPGTVFEFVGERERKKGYNLVSPVHAKGWVNRRSV